MATNHELRGQSLEYGKQALFWGETGEPIGLAPGRGVAEEDSAKVWMVDLDGSRPSPDCVFLIRAKPAGCPSDDFLKRLRQRLSRNRSRVCDHTRIVSGELGKDREFAVAVDECHRQVQAEEEVQSFARHRAWQHISTDDYAVDVGIPHLGQDRLESGKVPVNVIEDSHAHS
jgi:hypothetical protein